MLPQFIKYIFISFNIIFLCIKILNYKVARTFKILVLPFSIIFALIMSSFSNLIVIQRIFLLLLLISIYVSLCTRINYTKIIIPLIISLSISLVMYTLSGTIVGLIFLAKYKSAYQVPFLYTYLYTGFLQTLLTYLCIHIRRFINGIHTLIFTGNTRIGITFSYIVIINTLIFSIYPENTPIPIQSLLLLLLFLFSILLLYYWQHRITQTYRERLILANEKSLEDEIANLNSEKVALQTDNQRLTQIVHKDNKLVPAMEATVLEFLQSANTLSAEELTVRGNELSAALHEMAMERKGILTSLSPRGNHLPSLGLLSVDGLLSYMENRAKENSINYRVKIADNIKELSLRTIREEDLRHLLSDLIENAIIAVKCSTLPGHISIHFGTLQDNLLIEISDNGIPFTVETYQHFGYEQCSTHTDTGGTGTGLMDIWSLKKKYKASLYIYEYASGTNVYTKKISFLFDGKNHFLLKTYRDKEIKNTLIRGDLHVFSNKSE